TCDGLDNDCNGIIDDNQPPVAHANGSPLNPQACNDGNIGTCEGFGVYQCDGGNPTGPAICHITQPGAMPVAELCNGKDDDCDGVLDEGAPDTMVDVTNGSGTVLFHID